MPEKSMFFQRIAVLENVVLGAGASAAGGAAGAVGAAGVVCAAGALD